MATSSLEQPPVPPLAARCLGGSAAGIGSLGLLTDKVSLAQAGEASGWPFVPKSIFTLEAARTQLRAREPLAWLAKRDAHRAVTVSGPDDELDGLLLLQRRVSPPLLIDGRAWDLGVYVVFDQRPDGSLGTRLFDDVLLRFCTAPYASLAGITSCHRSPSFIS